MINCYQIRSALAVVFTAWKVCKYGVFSISYSVRMRENTDQKKLRIRTIFTQWLIMLFIAKRIVNLGLRNKIAKETDKLEVCKTCRASCFALKFSNEVGFLSWGNWKSYILMLRNSEKYKSDWRKSKICSQRGYGNRKFSESRRNSRKNALTLKDFLNTIYLFLLDLID